MGERERMGVTNLQVTLGNRTGAHSVHVTMAVWSTDELRGFWFLYGWWVGGLSVQVALRDQSTVFGQMHRTCGQSPDNPGGPASRLPWGKFRKITGDVSSVQETSESAGLQGFSEGVPHLLGKVGRGDPIHRSEKVGLGRSPGHSKGLGSENWPDSGDLRGCGQGLRTAGGLVNLQGTAKSIASLQCAVSPRHRALGQPPSAPAVHGPGLDAQWGPRGGVSRASGPPAASSPAPAPAARGGVRRARRSVAVDAEEAARGVWKAEAAYTRPAAAAARARIHDGVACAPVRQPACGAAVQQLQLPRGEELPHLGYGGAARCAGARRSGERHRPQWLQEEHAPCRGVGRSD